MSTGVTTDELASSQDYKFRAVATPSALFEAVRDGVQHIAVSGHLDLRGLRKDGTVSGESPLLTVNGTKSIRGDCKTPLPPGDPLRVDRMFSTQCVLRTDGNVLDVSSGDSLPAKQRLWIDNVYLTGHPVSSQAGNCTASRDMLRVGSGTELWMTSVSLIGARPSGEGNHGINDPRKSYFTRGLHILDGANVYARNVTVAYHTWTSAAAVWLGQNSTLAIVDSSFIKNVGQSVIGAGASTDTSNNLCESNLDNDPAPSPSPTLGPDTAPSDLGPSPNSPPPQAAAPKPASDPSPPTSPPSVTTESDSRRLLAVHARTLQQSSRPVSDLWLQNIQFSDNTVDEEDWPQDPGTPVPQIRVFTPTVTVYSDRAHMYYFEPTSTIRVPRALTPTSFQESGFLSENHQWFKMTEKESTEVTGARVLLPESPVNSFTSSVEGLGHRVKTSHTRAREAISIFLVPAILAGCILFIVLTVLVWRWGRSIRRSRKPDSERKIPSLQGRTLMPQNSARIPKLLRPRADGDSDALAFATVHQGSLPNSPLASVTKGSPLAQPPVNGAFSYIGPSHLQDGFASTASLSSRNMSINDNLPSPRRLDSQDSFHTASQSYHTATLATPTHSLRSGSFEIPAPNGSTLRVYSHLYAAAEPVNRAGSTSLQPSEGGTPQSRRHYFRSDAQEGGPRTSSGRPHHAAPASIDELQRALDEMHERGMPLNEFRVMPPSERRLRAGGNAVVQLVRRLSDNRQFAAKFYLDATPFDREAALRMSDRYEDLLPCPLYIDSNSHGGLCTASGTRIPPHAVFDKGECLEEWLESKPRTLRQCVGVLLAVANLLRAVHARGLAHRALHPRNIIWMPVSSEWTLADFGWAAQIGRSAAVRLDPPYTPPESTYAASHGGTCSVEASVDIWALGMIAQELIHGGLPTAQLDSPSERTMSDTDADHSPDASVQAYLTGVSSRLKISHTDTLDCESLKDGLLKEDYDSLAHSIQACLAHEPALRPNVIELSQQWKRVLEHGATGTL